MEGPLILLAAYLLLTPGVVLFMALHLYRRINGLKQRIEELESAQEAPAKPSAPAAIQRPQPVREPVPEPEPESESESVPAINWSVRIRDFLRQIGMWPPESVAGGDREAVLMQWWLPRVGGLLALLSALFFGVYINQSTPPWIRCLEMAGASLGISVLGRYMEGRFPHCRLGGALLCRGPALDGPCPADGGCRHLGQALPGRGR